MTALGRKLPLADGPLTARGGRHCALLTAALDPNLPLGTLWRVPSHFGHLTARYPEAMRSAPDKGNMADAIALIRKCAEDGVQLLGLDGFVASPEGFMAPVDLLLNVSDKGLTVEQAAAQSEAFVLLKDRPDVLWEVWTERS